MTQKCDGVKILDLEGKNSFTGAEYAVIAEKDANYKIPLEQIGDVIINSSKFKAKVDRAYTASVPTASVALEDNEFTFTFGIPAGSKGDPGYSGKDGKNGKDGRDGIDGVPGIDGDTIRNVIAYKSTSTTARPDTPVGGSWDAVNNIVIYPAGWVGTDVNPNGYVWMSTAAFSSNGTQVQAWTTPVRLTGEDGKDGADGTSIEFIYKLTVTSLTKPEKPDNNPNQTDYVPEGWTDQPSGISESYQCEWVCSRTIEDSGLWSDWQGPTIWSKWGVNGKDGDGREYIFQRTKLPAPPHNITDNNPDVDEYIPSSYPGEEPWTDDPSGVSQTYQYEWVSQRKYDGNTHKWGNFSSPALWAKYGDNGQDGMSIRVMYTRTSGSDVKPRDPDRLNINPGSIWGVGMPTATGKQAIWGIQALVTYDNKLYIDENLPEEERGWQGPYLITGVPGLDGNNFNYQVDAFKQATTKPDKPTSSDPYTPGNGWVNVPDMSTGTWWKSTALVQGETATVIEWGAVIKVTGQGIVIKGTLESTDDLPMTGNEIGDAYVIDGYLWVWNGETWVNVGTVQGADGNYTEYRFARNNSWSTPPSLNKSDRYPTGWSSTAPVLSDGPVLWATFATISGVDNTLLTDWADPYYMTGSTGASGIPGVGYEVKYCKGTETTYTGEQWSDSMKWKRNPTGWSLDVPELVNGDEYNYIWFIQCRIINDTMETAWSKPNPMGGIIVPDPVGSQPIIYPQGIYSTTTPYINDGEKAPYVYDTSDGNFYYLKSVMTWIGTQQNNVSPATDTSGAWAKLENYEAVFANVLITPNALVGGAVFNNNLMFSQRGKNASNEDSSQYQLINTDDPMNTSNAFRPNFLLDFANGEAYFGAGGVHLAANGADTSIEVVNNNNSVRLSKEGIRTRLGNTIFGVSEAGMSLDIMETGTQVSVSSPIVINKDGAGSLANRKIRWTGDGNLSISTGLTVGDSTATPHTVFAEGYTKLNDGSADVMTFGYDKTVSAEIRQVDPNNTGNQLILRVRNTDDEYPGPEIRLEEAATQATNAHDTRITPGSITLSVPNGRWISIMSDMITFGGRGDNVIHQGYTGTKNGCEFINGICVGTV